MRIASLLALLLLSMMSYSQDVDIPDPQFLAALIAENVDRNGDGVIQQTRSLSCGRIRH